TGDRRGRLPVEHVAAGVVAEGPRLRRVVELDHQPGPAELLPGEPQVPELTGLLGLLDDLEVPAGDVRPVFLHGRDANRFHTGEHVAVLACDRAGLAATVVDEDREEGLDAFIEQFDHGAIGFGCLVLDVRTGRGLKTGREAGAGTRSPDDDNGGLRWRG